MKYLKILLWICVFLTAGAIFAFSSQNAGESDKVSKGITRKVVDTLPQTKNKSEHEKEKIVKKINSYVRKTAHYSLFFAFGLFLLSAMLVTYSDKYSVIKLLLICTIIALLYAISDEVHQIFVPERGPAVKDVFIDFSGSVSAFLIVLFVRKVKCKIKKSISSF